MQRHVSNMSQTIIEPHEVTSCDISRLVNSIPETPNTVRSSPNSDPESPVFPKHTIQRKNELQYSTTISEKESEQPVLNVHFSEWMNEWMKSYIAHVSSRRLFRALYIESNLARPVIIQIPTQSPGRYTAELPLRRIKLFSFQANSPYVPSTHTLWIFCDTADKDNTPNGKENKSHESSNKEDEDSHCSPKDCSRLRGLEQKLQDTTDKNTTLVKQICGLRQQSIKQRKENIKLIKGRDSLMTEKIEMRKEITRLEQKLEKANQNRHNKIEKKVTFIENGIDDNGNAWETVGATKSKNSIKTRTAVDTCAKATPTKGQKVIENKKQKKQTRQKTTVKKPHQNG